MDPQDQNQNPTDDQGGSTPADGGQTGGDQPMSGGQPQTPPSTEPPAEDQGEIAPPPPAAEEPGDQSPSEAPSGQ